MAETVNVAHAADQMRAGRRTDHRQRHGFFQAPVKENPGDFAARIGGGGVGRAPDAVARAKQDLVGVMRVDGHAARPVRRMAVGGVGGQGIIQSSVGHQNALPSGSAVGAAEHFILQAPPVHGGGHDGGGMLGVHRHRTVTPAEPLAVGGFLRRDVRPDAVLGIVFPQGTIADAVRPRHGAVSEIVQAVHGSDEMAGPAADGLAGDGLPGGPGVGAAEQVGAGAGNRRVNHRRGGPGMAAGRIKDHAHNPGGLIATAETTATAAPGRRVGGRPLAGAAVGGAAGGV